MDIEAAKARLQAILNAARLRREGVEASDTYAPAVAEPQPQPVVESPKYSVLPNHGLTPDIIAEIEAAVTPKPAETVPDPNEPTPSTHPDLFIEERTAELVLLKEPNGVNGEVILREVLSGRFISTWRRRTPADGSEAFVLVPPKSRWKSDPKAKAEEGPQFEGWGSHPGRIDPRVIARYAKTPTSTFVPWIERNGRFALDRRNSGVLRADGTIEE